MKRAHLLPGLVLAGTMATALPALAAEEYVFDQSHTQILFEYDHLDFSVTQGAFTAWEGTLMVDEADPAASRLDVTLQADSLETGAADRNAHLLSDDFFAAEAHPAITFVSTAVEQIGESTLAVTGDMTIRGTTVPVTFDVVVNQLAAHPMTSQRTLGFTATTTVSRSAFGLDMFTPYVGDAVAIRVSGEAIRKADLPTD